MCKLYSNAILRVQLMNQGLIINACAARVTVVGLCVCVSVTTFSATMRNKPAKKRHQRVQRYTGFILKMAIFVKVLRSKVMASQQAQLVISTGLPRPGPLALCI